MKNQPTQPTAGKAAPLRPVAIQEPTRQKVYTLAMLQQQCETKKEVQFTLDNIPYAVEVRTLTPDEDAQLEQILDAVVPPMRPVPGGKAGDAPMPDIANVEYQKKKSEAGLMVRALALYWAVPIFCQEKPGLTNGTDIKNFIQSKLNNAILDVLFAGVRNGRIGTASLVNFT